MGRKNNFKPQFVDVKNSRRINFFKLFPIIMAIITFACMIIVAFVVAINLIANDYTGEGIGCFFLILLGGALCSALTYCFLQLWCSYVVLHVYYLEKISKSNDNRSDFNYKYDDDYDKDELPEI